MTSPRSTTQGVAADHGRIARRRSRALAATALRTRSVHAREVLAELAWPGHTPADLADWATRPSDAGPPPGADPLGVADHARVLAVQTGEADDVAVARGLLEQLFAPGSTVMGGLRREHVEMLAQLRVLGGDPEGAVRLVADRRVRPGVASSVRADALHPRLNPAAADRGQDWARAFSAALGSGRLAPVLPPPPGSAPDLDRLAVSGTEPVRDSGLVTVLMSSYRPGPALLTAVRSVLAQTWADLELLVVDDASGPSPGHAALLAQVEALDPRVRVIRKAVNGGTYRARNTALRQARGEFAIVVDSDDWWHPQTLETCLGPLLADPGLLATRAQGVRVSPDLVLTRPGYQPRFASAATVCFRLRPVLSRIGFFDPTRKGADTEFARRLEAACGPVIRDIEETTTILRGGGSTLSSEEFANGYRHPARQQYKALYTPWHEAVTAGAQRAYLDPEQPRRFPEPHRWSRPTHPLLRTTPETLDLVIAGDWRKFGGPQRSMMEEIRAALDAGLRVGVMHLEALRFMSAQDQPLVAPFTELVRSGAVSWVQPDDDVDIDVLLVRYPPILQYPPRLSRVARVRQVLVMANQGPVEPDGTDQRYVVADVTGRARELFGAPVTWVPQSPTIRRVLREQDPSVPLTDWDNPGLIDADAWAVRPTARAPGAGGTVVVGRHSRDDRIKFPTSWAALERGYAFGPGHEIRILGGEQTVEALRAAAADRGEPPQLPAGWRVLPATTEDVRPFLADLDFYVYLDNPDAHEAFGRTLLEAAASGVLTIADPKHRPTFGDLVDYAAPGEAQALVARYAADPAAYRARVERTLALVRERYGRSGFVDRIRPLLQDAPPASGPAAPSPLTLPLRSAGDATRADALRVEHDALSSDVLAAWLVERVPDPPGPDWSPAGVLDGAPDGVRRVRLEQGGLVLEATRDRGSPDRHPGSGAASLDDGSPGTGATDEERADEGPRDRAYRAWGEPPPGWTWTARPRWAQRPDGLDDQHTADHPDTDGAVDHAPAPVREESP
ncbi:glycosyltransferase [Serinicoccus marinus]|uniref:glycosyltransferase n=1 Tax=Serinicoccus marinus TaxID=247333 RepID=UPI0003B64F35|nr:glycosyltransferase [Serinicoccus marinus]